MLKKHTMYLGIVLLMPLNVWACDLDNPDYQFAKQLYNEKQFASSIKVFSDIEQKYPNCQIVKLDLAMAYWGAGDIDETELRISKLVQMPALKPQLRAQAIFMLNEAHKKQLQVFQREREKRIQVTSRMQFATAMGTSNNVNNGVSFDKFTFDSGLVLPLAEQSKAQSGQWQDLEWGYQKQLKPEAQLSLNVAWRNHFSDDKLDTIVSRAVMAFKPGDMAKKIEPQVVLSGGNVTLGGHYYRQDLAVGMQVRPEVGKRKVTLGYQFMDTGYRQLDDTDNRVHRVMASVPLSSDAAKLKVNLDSSYQWPSSAERLADYHEASVRVRANMALKNAQEVSVSYGVTQQSDENAYNTLIFGDKKRNLHQKVMDVGWSKKAGRNMFYEARVQSRRLSSDVQLFNSSAVDVLAGLRWQLE